MTNPFGSFQLHCTHTHIYTLSPIHTDDYDDDGDDASSDDFESDDDGHMWLHS